MLAGNFVICLLSRLTGYSTDPVAYVVVPLDNFVFVLFLLLAVLLLNSVCFDSGEAHIFWGTTMQFALFLLLREVCFVVLGLLDLSVGFWPVYGVRMLSLLLWAALWGTGLLRWIREQLKEGDTPLCIIIGNSFLILLLAWRVWQADLLRTNLWLPIMATLFGIIGFDRWHGSSLGSEPHPISTQRPPVGAISSYGGRIGGVCTSPTA